MTDRIRNPEQVVKAINTLLDRLVCIAPVDMKTCQYRISAEGERITRAGRFSLHQSEHDNLIREDGFYLFVVQKHVGTPIMWLSPAAEVPFFHQLSWTVAIKTKKGQKTATGKDATADKVLSEYTTTPTDSTAPLTI
jgi:hypothetical protein